MKNKSSQQGQAITEYILILSIVFWGTLAITKTLVSSLDKGIKIFAGQLEKDLKTGRAPLNAWSN